MPYEQYSLSFLDFGYNTFYKLTISVAVKYLFLRSAKTDLFMFNNSKYFLKRSFMRNLSQCMIDGHIFLYLEMIIRNIWLLPGITVNRRVSFNAMGLVINALKRYE